MIEDKVNCGALKFEANVSSDQGLSNIRVTEDSSPVKFSDQIVFEVYSDDIELSPPGMYQIELKAYIQPENIVVKAD